MSGTGNRKIILFSFTGTGASLGRRLCRKLEETDHIWEAYAPEKYAQEGVRPMPADRAELIGGQWGRAAFLFIGAAGIAVRFIAPWVKDKYTDSPVLVLDEKGRYVIPLLSGHVGGAAALADEIARLNGRDGGPHYSHGCTGKVCRGCICEGTLSGDHGPGGGESYFGSRAGGREDRFIYRRVFQGYAVFAGGEKSCPGKWSSAGRGKRRMRTDIRWSYPDSCADSGRTDRSLKVSSFCYSPAEAAGDCSRDRLPERHRAGAPGRGFPGCAEGERDQHPAGEDDRQHRSEKRRAGACPPG